MIRLFHEIGTSCWIMDQAVCGILSAVLKRLRLLLIRNIATNPTICAESPATMKNAPIAKTPELAPKSCIHGSPLRKEVLMLTMPCIIED